MVLLLLKLFYTFSNRLIRIWRRLRHDFHDTRRSSHPLRMAQFIRFYGHHRYQPDDSRSYRYQFCDLRRLYGYGKCRLLARSRHIRLYGSHLLSGTALVYTHDIYQSFFLKYQRHPAVEAVFNGLRPGVVGLLAAAALVLMNGENFGTDTYQVVISILLFIGCFIASNRYRVNPILLIVCSGILGYFIY